MKTQFSIMLFVSLALSVSALAQCVLDPIHVGRVEGRVLFGFQNQYRVLDKAESAAPVQRSDIEHRRANRRRSDRA